MRRMFFVPLTVAAFVLGVAGPASASHVPTSIVPPRSTYTGQALLTVGDIQWVGNTQAAHGVAAPLGEMLPFSRDGRKYMIASDSVYGLTVIDVTNPKTPVSVSTYASSFGCPTADPEFIASSGLAQDPRNKFGSVLINAGLGATGWENDLSVTPDGRIAVIGMDAPGRCHDPMAGGLEFVDLTDLSNPRPLHLTRNVGDAHSAGIDPFHPWLAWVSSSDGNDFVDVIDFRSCLGGVANIEACAPTVGRIPFTQREYPSLRDPAAPARDKVSDGCHDVRFTATRAYCAAIDNTLIFDTTKIAGASLADGEGLSGTLLTSGPNACNTVDATRAPGVKVTDCSGWNAAAWEQRSGAGVDAPLIALIEHDGSKPATQDISIAHQAEPIEGGKILLITDERGGGLNAGTPACPGGGAWFYDIRDEAHPKLMKTSDGDAAVFISSNTIQSPFSCTIHYGEQFGDEPVLTFGWYSAGTHVIKIKPDYSATPATIDFEEVAAIVPIGALTIQAKPIARDPDDPDRILVYAADAARGLDVFSVRFPRPVTATKVLSSRNSGSTGKGTKVLGATETQLPKTGLWDPSIGVGVLGMAAGLANWTRRRRF